MKKYLFCVALLLLSAISFHTAWAKTCGSKGGTDFKISGGVLSFDSDCTVIADHAFQSDSSFSSVIFPASLTSIGIQSFSDCDALTSVDLSNTSLSSIGYMAFDNCDALTSVDLSNTPLTTIGELAFDENPSLTSVIFPSSLTSIGDGAFMLCIALTSVDLSNTSLSSIGIAPFFGFISLTSAAFPASLTSIGEGAFAVCLSLASVDLSNTSLSSIGEGAFAGIAKPSTVTVAKGSKAHEQLGDYGLSSITGDKVKAFYTDYADGSITITGYGNTTLIVSDTPTPTPTPTPEPGTVSGAAEVIRVVPLPEDEFGSYELDPVTGEKNYLMFHTYDICMDFLNNDELCSGYDRCYHK